MAERDSWATMNGATRIVDAEDSRLATAALLTPGATLVSARQGIRPGPGNPFFVQATGTPGANVTCQLGQMVITATRGFGSYIATLDATKTVAILDVPADPTNQRNDLIIATQSDTYYADGSTVYIVRRVQGTPNASPVDPSLSGFPDRILLARVRVTANATTITNAMIDDLRPGWTVSLGGLLPVADGTARGLITSPYSGQPVYRMDRAWIEVYDGAAWRIQNVAVCSSTADRDAAITSPYNGQQAYTTDTNTLWMRASGVWVEFTNQPTANMRQTVSQSIPNNAFTTLLFDVEDFDNFNGHSIVTNTSRYTLQRNGKYMLGGAIGCLFNASGSRGTLWLQNGVQVNGSQLLLPANGGGLNTIMPARSMPVIGLIGDIIELQGYQNSGAPLGTTVSGSDQSSFSIERIGG